MTRWPPLRTIVTIAIVLALASIAIWTVVVLPRCRALPLTGPQRTTLTIIVVVVLVGVIGWLIFVLPAYWD
jgi:hypothetical protein